MKPLISIMVAMVLATTINTVAISGEVRLKWINPTSNADTIDCSQPGTVPLTDFRGTKWWAVRFNAIKDTLFLGEVPAPHDSADFVFADSVTMGEIIGRSVDNSGNMSCNAVHYVFNIPMPDNVVAPVDSLRGLKGEYYTYDRWNDFKSFLGEKVDSMISFDWGAGAGWPGGPADYWSVRWTGTLTVPTSGDWSYYIYHDAGARVFIDGAQIIPAWSDTTGESVATVYLPAGPHPIKVEFYENWGNAKCLLSWSGPGVAKQVIPSQALGR